MRQRSDDQGDGQLGEADLQGVVAEHPLHVQGSRKNIPNIPATNSAWMMFAPATLRERNRRSGISGLAMRAWRATNAISSATERPPNPSVWSDPQP